MSDSQREGERDRGTKSQRFDSPSVKNLLHSFQVHKHAQLQQFTIGTCLSTAVLSEVTHFKQHSQSFFHHYLLTLQAFALALLFLSTHMPELLSPIKCKSLSYWLTHARSTKQEEAISPLLGAIEMSLNAVPEISPAAQALIFNSFIFQMLWLFRKLTYSALYSQQRTEFSWQNSCCLLKTDHLP